MDESRFAPPSDAEPTWAGRIPDERAGDPAPPLQNSQAGLQMLAELAKASVQGHGPDALDLAG